MKKQNVEARRLTIIDSYAFIVLSNEALLQEHKTGIKVLNLAMGNPDIPPNPIYKEKLRELVTQNNLYRYPPYGASENFSQALIEWYKKRFKVTLKSNEIYPLHGAKEGISLLPLALCNPGDEILIPNPGYPAYSVPAELTQAKITRYTLGEEQQFKPNIEDIKQLIHKNTRAIWLNFPSNPTGQVLTKHELIPLVQLAQDRNILLLYDNTYSEITYDGFSAPSILEIEGAKDVAIEIGSFSKTYSFAGLRLGWIVGNAKVIASLAKLKSQLDSGVPLLIQELGAFVLTHKDKEWQRKIIRTYEDRRNEMMVLLERIHVTPYIPKGAIYVWAKIPDSEKNCEQYCKKMLEQRNILLAQGAIFGTTNDRFVRVSLCKDQKTVKEYLTE